MYVCILQNKITLHIDYVLPCQQKRKGSMISLMCETYEKDIQKVSSSGPKATYWDNWATKLSLEGGESDGWADLGRGRGDSADECSVELCAWEIIIDNIVEYRISIFFLKVFPFWNYGLQYWKGFHTYHFVSI